MKQSLWLSKWKAQEMFKFIALNEKKNDLVKYTNACPVQIQHTFCIESCFYPQSETSGIQRLLLLWGFLCQWFFFFQSTTSIKWSLNDAFGV